MKQTLWDSPAKAGVETIVNVVDELARLVRDATELGHADGERNWPLQAGGATTEAETTLRARAQQLMLRLTLCFNAELTRAQHAVAAATARHRRVAQRLPEVLRRAKAVFDEQAVQIESPLLEAARHAEAAQRKKRSDELRAGASFDGRSAGAFPLMLATLFGAACLESALTAMLISDSHPQGLLGAASLAATVAGLQLAYAFGIGCLLRWLFDREEVGWRVSAAGIGLLAVAGLGLGHAVMGRLRELTLAIDYETAMRQAVPDVLGAHLLPTEASAVLLSLVGIACGLGGMVMGARRADAKRAEREGKIASAAEDALEGFRQVRAEVEGSANDKQASALLDALEAEVTQAHRELGEAVHDWNMKRASLAGTQAELVSTYRIAIECYRVRAMRVRSDDSVPAHWNDAEAVEALAVPAFEIDDAQIETARILLSDGQFQQSLDAARQELDRCAKAQVNRRCQRIAQLEDVVYRDWFRPADGQPQRAPTAQLVPVGEVRRMVTQA
jgi:hypothetical protein